MSLKPRTWYLDDFSGGIDTRDGTFSHRQNSFAELVNYVITNGKKIRRRWPYLAGGLTLPTPSQGLIPFNGALRTVQRRENVDDPETTDITALAFDTPDNYGEGWELVDWAVFESTVLALIRHDHPNAATPSIVRLHVLGGPRTGPTYVEDPHCPSNWIGGTTFKPSAGKYVEAWNPRIVVAQGKAYITTADGNVAFCKTGNPRAWNTRSIVTMSESGQELAFLVPDDGAFLKRWDLTEYFEDFQTTTLTDKYRFSAYVLEWYDEYTDAWIALQEVDVSPSVNQTYCLTEITNRWLGSTKTETRIELRWTGSPVMLRFRMILDERTSNLSGQVIGIAGTDITVSQGGHEITKDGTSTDYATDAVAATAVPVTSWVLADSTGITTAYATDQNSNVTITGTVPNGYARWNNHVVGYVRNQAGVLAKASMSIDESWQAVRKIMLAGLAGGGDDADAGVLNTSAHTGAGGGQVTALAIIRQRLLLWYAKSSQLWAVGPLADDHELIDTGLVGTGTQPTPEPAPLEDGVIIATPQGLRQFSIESLQEAYIREVGIGDQLRKLVPAGTTPTQKAAAYWPWTGEYVTAVELNGQSFMLCFDYAPASEIGGWSKWTMVGYTSPDRRGLAVLEDKLYVRQGNVVHRWDAAVQTFRDVDDPAGAGNAFTSRAVWHFNDFKSPSTLKMARHIDVAQIGTASYALRYQPAETAWQTEAITISGSTRGKGAVPFIATGPALALVLTSTDETGHELESVAIEFIERSR